MSAPKHRDRIRDYEALRKVAESEGLGYRAAAKRLSMSTKAARTLYERGLPARDLPPLRDVLGRRASSPQEAGRMRRGGREAQRVPVDAVAAVVSPESLEAAEREAAAEESVADIVGRAAEQTIESVAAGARRAQAHAAATVIAELEDELEGMALDYAKHEHQLLKERVAGMPLEGAIVKQTRGAAVYLLGHTITLLKAAGPMLARFERDVQSPEFLEDLPVQTGLALLMQITRLAHRVVDLGDKAMSLQRKLLGQPESILGMAQASAQQGAELTVEEAAEGLSHLVTALEHAQPELHAIDGGLTVDAPSETGMTGTI